MTLITTIRKWLPITLTLLAVACGSITFDVDTEVKDADAITHDIVLTAEGEIVQIMTEGEGFGEFAESFEENCTMDFDTDNLEIACLDVSHEEMKKAEGGDLWEIEVTVRDLGDKLEYRATSPNVIYGSEEEFEDNILKARHYWTLTMPGEIVETNADSTNEDGSVEFVGKIGDERETFTAISHKDKGFSLFGLCN